VDQCLSCDLFKNMYFFMVYHIAGCYRWYDPYIACVDDV